MTKYVSEFLGTGILFCVVVGSGIMGQGLSPENEQITLLANTLATVFALYFLINSFQSYSSHFNPAVSLIVCLKGEISVKTCTVFVALQIAGAILGVMLANYMFEIDPVNFSEKARSGTNLFVSEIVATFGLLLVILLASAERVAGMVAAYIGAAYWFTSSTSFANPAGTIGRALSNTFAGISPDDVMAFCAAQVIGAFLAYILYKNVFSRS
jgi:glycerol uptake facilitator-like aquaporin